MRKISEILRLHVAGLSGRQIAASLGISRTAVSNTLKRAEAAAITWPLPEELDEPALQERLYPAPEYSSVKRSTPAWNLVHKDLKRKGVTLALLWEEYKAIHPGGYQYSRFCELYRAWRLKLDVTMRQDHKAGEKLFVDYAGQTMDVIDPETGEARPVQIFVAVLGASSYTYVEATWTQALEDWTGSHRRAFEFFGGVPEIVVPDNLKSGVTKAHLYEPDINPTYQDLAAHYGVAVIPARVRKPRDKAKVESAVQVAERWILARLRDHRFFSLHELNAAIAEQLTAYNERPFQKLEGSRHSVFLEVDRPVLNPLPANSYVFARWKKARVHMDYHVDIEGHYYSVPYKHVREQIDVRITELTIECFFQGKRIASHGRNLRRGRHTTIREHMPPNHRHYADWTPERLATWAARTGPNTRMLIEQVIASRERPQHGYRACLGILRLGEAHGADRLEAAAVRALATGALSYRSMASILKKGLDTKAVGDRESPGTDTFNEPTRHANLRGPAYYSFSSEPPKFS